MEIEILKFADQKHRVTFSIPHQKWKVDYNKLIVWMKKNFSVVGGDIPRLCDSDRFKKIFSIINILDHSVIAKFVPAIFIVSYINPKHLNSEYLLYDVRELYGNIGDHKLCQLAFEELWHEDFNLAEILWHFSNFKPTAEKFQVKIAGTTYTSNAFYGLFIPIYSKYDHVEHFKWKIKMFKLSIDELHIIRQHLNNEIVRAPGHISTCTEHKLRKIIDNIILKRSKLTLT